MRERAKKFVISVMVTLGMLVPVMPVAASVPVMTDCVDTNLFGNCSDGGGINTDSQGGGIMKLLSLVVTVLLYGIGAAAVIGVVIAGILYLTARDNEAQMAKAKTRLVEVAIGLIAWALLFTLLQWLIPNFTGDELESSRIVTDSILA